MSVNEIIKILKDIINHNDESRLRTAKLLIKFKSKIRGLNRSFKHAENRSNHYTNKDFDRMLLICKEQISVISTWCILINLGIIIEKDVEINLGGFLAQEHLMLKPLLIEYSKDKTSPYYYDALKCIKLFNECARKVG